LIERAGGLEVGCARNLMGLLAARLSQVLAVGAFLAAPSWALALPCEEVDREAESAAFRQGLERYRAGDAAGAVDIWKRLLETLGTECGWKVLFNLGRGYEKLGDPTNAIESYSEFIAASDRQPSLDDKARETRAEARASIERLKAKYGAIVVPAPERGVVLVRVGMGEPQPAGFTLYVAPGKHQIEIHSRTARATLQSVSVRAGQATRITIPSVEAPAAPAADRPPEPPTVEPRRFPVALVAIGSGLTLAAGGATVYLYTRQASKRDEAEQVARSDPRYASLRDEHGDARDLYHAGLITTGVLATATAAVVVVHLLGRDAPVQAHGTAGPAAGYVGVSGRF
jgi:hypothetical protein